MQYGNKAAARNVLTKKRQSSQGAPAERSASRPKSSYQQNQREQIKPQVSIPRPQTARPISIAKKKTRSQKSLKVDIDEADLSQTKSPEPTPKQNDHKQPKLTRPTTAKTSKFNKNTKKQTKTDPVSRYQSMQNQWSQSAFLSKNGQTGRKLELDRFNKWR